MKILCFGSGYVAQHLSKYFDIAITTRSQEKKSALGAQAICFSFGDQDMLKSLVQEYDTFFLTIAPSKGDSYEDTYLKSALSLQEVIKPSHKHLIYTSSTSVYAENQGHVVIEDSPIDDTDPFASTLIQTEKIIHSLPIRTTIFRLSEIYGPNRSIAMRVQEYKGKKAPGTGGNFANMIHIDDIVSAFSHACIHSLEGIYNLSDLDHPTRKQMYEKAASLHHLEPIFFDPSLHSRHSKNKIVDCSKLIKTGYRFIHPHREL